MNRYHILVATLTLALSACAAPLDSQGNTTTPRVFATSSPTATDAPVAQPTATLTLAPTDTLALPPPTPTLFQPTAKVPQKAPAPSPSTTPEEVLYRFDDGVTPPERDIIQKSIALATSYIGGVGQVTVYANTNLDALADAADRFYSRTQSSPASQGFRRVFRTDGAWNCLPHDLWIVAKLLHSR